MSSEENYRRAISDFSEVAIRLNLVSIARMYSCNTVKFQYIQPIVSNRPYSLSLIFHTCIQ